MIKSYQNIKGAITHLANGRPIKRIMYLLSPYLLYKIGGKYKYPQSDQVYVLKEVKGWVFIFKCGWRVTDSVFEDMIDTSTGLASWQTPKQLTLFN